MRNDTELWNQWTDNFENGGQSIPEYAPLQQPDELLETFSDLRE
jgi:hypothetical protein